MSQNDATIKSDQAAIDNAKLQLVYAHITSPLTGRIGLRLVDQGNMVHATDANGLAVITQLQPIAVIFNIAEDSLPEVTKKMAAGQTLPVFAYDRDLKQKLATGTLLTIDNQIDQTTGTVKFKGVFENKDLSLFPNQFVNARLLLDTKHGAVHRSHRGHPAQPAIDLRIRGEGGQHGGGAQHQGRGHGRRRSGGGQRPRRRAKKW